MTLCLCLCFTLMHLNILLRLFLFLLVPEHVNSLKKHFTQLTWLLIYILLIMYPIICIILLTNVAFDIHLAEPISQILLKILVKRSITKLLIAVYYHIILIVYPRGVLCPTVDCNRLLNEYINIKEIWIVAEIRTA